MGYSIKQLLTIVIVIIITVSPWIIRNYKYTGRLLISTHGSFGLWQGNNEYSYEYLIKNISLDLIYRRQPPLDIYQKYPMKGREPKEAVHVADEYKKEAQKWIKGHPEEFIKLSIIKAQKLWTWNRNPSGVTFDFGSNKSRQSVYLISFLPLLFCMPFGLYFLYKKNKSISLTIIGILICFTAAHMIVMGFTRARIPIDPLLMICFGIVMDVIVQKYFKKNKNQDKEIIVS